jgi:hypothetical protein
MGTRFSFCGRVLSEINLLDTRVSIFKKGLKTCVSADLRTSVTKGGGQFPPPAPPRLTSPRPSIRCPCECDLSFSFFLEVSKVHAFDHDQNYGFGEITSLYFLTFFNPTGT